MNCLICKSNKNVNFIDKYKFEVVEDKKYLKEMKIFRCENCEFGFINPMPKEDDLEYYYKEIYRAFDRPPYFLANIKDLKLECMDDRNLNYLVYLSSLLDFSKIKKIYDFGAGNGDLGYLLKKNFLI